MTTQMLEKPTEIYNLFSLPLIMTRPQIEFTPMDLGYEIDEEEIAGEMFRQNTHFSPGSDTPEIAPEEFEAIYGYFLS